MSETKKKGNPVVGFFALVVLIAVPIIIFSSCSSHDDTTSSAAAATSTSAIADPVPPAAHPSTDQEYLGVLRIAGVSGTDNDLLTDGLSTCMEFRQTSDTAIGIGVQLTAPPFNFEQHTADMIVINAVKYICPEFQSKIDNPTN